MVPRWRDPAFAAIADQPSVQHQIPHQEIRVALEPRSSRCRSLQGLLLHTDTRGRLATSTTLAAVRRPRRGSLLHPARLDRRTALQAFQPRNLVTLLGDHPLEIRHLTQQLHHKLQQFRMRQTRQLRWGGHIQVEFSRPVSAQPFSQTPPTILPQLLWVDNNGKGRLRAARDTECRMMVKATPTAAFIVTETKFLLEFEINSTRHASEMSAGSVESQ